MWLLIKISNSGQMVDSVDISYLILGIQAKIWEKAVQGQTNKMKM